jgi:antitoxin YokJ
MIRQLLDRISQLEGCSVLPPAGSPNVRLELPNDLSEFYSLCGGLMLFKGALFPFEVVGPDEFEPANIAILGLGAQEDRSDDWYMLARSGSDQFVSVDLFPARVGRCYDSFVDRHAIAGSCAVVARSFSEFLKSTIDCAGHRLYWLDPRFEGLGDAYD